MTAAIVSEKICATCKILKPLSGFSKHSRSKDGLQSRCKACISEYMKVRYQSKKDEIKAKTKAWTEANKDRVKEYRSRQDVKDRANALRNGRYWDDPETARRKRREWYENNPEKVAAYRSLNRSHLNEMARKYREKNADQIRFRQRIAYALDPEKYREKQRQYRLRNPEKVKELNRSQHIKHAEKRIAWTKAWRERNVEHVKAYTARYEESRRERRNAQKRIDYAINPERGRAASKAWRADNPEAKRMQKHRRRARKKNSGGVYTKADVQRLFMAQRGHCPVCRKPLKNYHIDHIVALANGGSNGPENLQLLHPICNQRKSNKDPIEFMQEQGFLL